MIIHSLLLNQFNLNNNIMEVKDVIDILVPLISDFVYILFNLCIKFVILALIRVRICFIEVLNNSFKHCV